MATRRYEQRQRAEAAEQTRRDILDAVYEHLRTAPSTPVGLEQVARTAGVARSTVYLVFGSRAGLFDAFSTHLWWERAGFQRVVDAVEHPDAREHLRGGIEAGVRVFAAHRDVFRALFSMAALDADAVGGAIGRIEENRSGGMAHLAGRLAEANVLRPELTAAAAADLLWLLTSFDSFDQLYTGRNLAVDEVAATLVAAAERGLYRRTAPRKSARPPSGR